MKALNEYIYGAIQAAVDSESLGDNVYFSFLPQDWNRGLDSIVYETEIQESFSTLHDDNYAQSVRLRIKVLSQDSAKIYELSDSIKEIVLLAENNDLRDIQFIRNTYLFDERLDTHSFSNDFDIYLSKSAIERINISGGLGTVTTQEKIMNGIENFITLSAKIETNKIIAVTVGGMVQGLPHYTVDNTGTFTKITLDEVPEAYTGLRLKVIYLD